MANIDIYVIGDATDIVSTIARGLTVGDVPVAGVHDMVTQIGKKCAGGDKIRELRIVGHGTPDGQYVGSDWINSQTVDWHGGSWAGLKPLFDPSKGLVTLGACQVGQASLLLVKLSNYLGVPVRGFRTFQNPIIPGDEGGETKCFYFSCTKTTKRFTVYDEQAVSVW
jgi:hypothetical protein